MKAWLVATWIAACVAVAGTAGAQGKSKWNLVINETRGPVRAADMQMPLKKDAVTQILAGPTNGSDNGYLLFTRMPAGAHGPALYTLPDDILANNPETKLYKFTKVDDQIVLVDPTKMRVIAVIGPKTKD